jgi:hypothetical protein
MWHIASMYHGMPIYEDLEGFFPFQNMHADVHVDQFSKMVSRTPLWNQQDDSNEHSIICVCTTTLSCVCVHSHLNE